MEDSVLNRISKQHQTIQDDDTLLKHDIKIQELDQRLRSLENLVNEIHNKYPVWWGNK